MKPRAHIPQCLLAALLLMAAAGPRPLIAAPPSPLAKVEIKPSVFVSPTAPPVGRDPFFPSSKRVFVGDPKNPVSGPSLADLTLKSILGTPPRVFAVINNHTFGPGDDGDITTKSGQRLHVRCVDINPKAGTATVAADGMSEVLHLASEP